jgi:hypothetical protein
MGDNDKDKSITKKTTEAVKDIATIASDAATKAMEPEPIRPGDRIAMVPLLESGLMFTPVMPSFIVLPRRKSRAKTASKKTAKKADKKPVAKKSSKKKEAAKARKAVAKALAKKKTAKSSKKNTKSRR